MDGSDTFDAEFNPHLPYDCECFTRGCETELNGLVSRFLWGGLVDNRTMHLVNWESVTSPDKLGGLEIIDLGNMNKALVVKWIYSFANNKDVMWQKLVFACSHGNPHSLLPSLGNRSNDLVVLGFVESTIGWTGPARDMVNQHFKTLIGDG